MSRLSSKERVRESKRRWRLNNPDKVRESNARQREKKSLAIAYLKSIGIADAWKDPTLARQVVRSYGIDEV